MNNDSGIKYDFLNALKNDLPGEVSHLKMIPESRLNTSLNFDKKTVKKSAVLLLLFPEDNSLKLLFIKRATDGSSHSGQIAFPGGKFENKDNDLKETALRETEEEIGIKKKDIQVLKQLTSLFIPVSNFSVNPFVGIIEYKPVISMNSDEVEEVFTVDLEEILSAKRTERTFNVRNQTITAPFFIFDEFEIWGASAMILSEFIDLIKPGF